MWSENIGKKSPNIFPLKYVFKMNDVLFVSHNKNIIMLFKIVCKDGFSLHISFLDGLS